MGRPVPSFQAPHRLAPGRGVLWGGWEEPSLGPPLLRRRGWDQGEVSPSGASLFCGTGFCGSGAGGGADLRPSSLQGEAPELPELPTGQARPGRVSVTGREAVLALPKGEQNPSPESRGEAVTHEEMGFMVRSRFPGFPLGDCSCLSPSHVPLGDRSPRKFCPWRGAHQSVFQQRGHARMDRDSPVGEPLGGPGGETARTVLSPGASTGPGRGTASAHDYRLIRGVSEFVRG